MVAVICCLSSPCSAAGSTTRAAATGSTEPERLRQLSGVTHHCGDVTEMVANMAFNSENAGLIRKNSLF
jgi:hypothetical protein|nr:MAG TPA: hypothetical protein [Caudoviricetes sp.]